MAWAAPENLTCTVSAPTGEIHQVRPIDPLFWPDEGNIEVERYFALHDSFLAEHCNAGNVVYHYTTLQGFHGIVKDGAIWASDARVLNDRLEVKYALEQMRSYIANANGKNIAQQALNAVFRGESFWQFVSCFSLARDQLSQWRAYTSNVGVAIGFDREHLVRAVEGLKGHARLCRYLAPSAFSELRPELDEIASALQTPKALNSSGALIDMDLQEKLTRQATKLATSIKHPSFSEERELRLIVSHHDCHDKVEYRASTNTLIPYTKIDIDIRRLGTQRPQFSNHLGMMEIVVWPSDVDNQVLDAIRMVFGEAGHPLIVRSASPYRT